MKMSTTRGIGRGLRWAAVAGAAALFGGAGLAGSSFAAGAPNTAEVLGKLHQADQKEIEAGKMAQKNGQSTEVKDYGKTLVKDHTAADKKVSTLAKQEKIDLRAATPTVTDERDQMHQMAAGTDFDVRFARDMLEDHKKDIAAVTEARDKTDDEKLKKLLSDLLPTLQKHEEMAQKIIDSQGGQGSRMNEQMDSKAHDKTHE